MNKYLLSVIIPTHNRPKYLPRAVKSALDAAPNGDVEVIVVPNGGDETWRESLADLLVDPRIIVSPIEIGHANVARNHGMSLATGKYIRFLDDDDYLLPHAKFQLDYMEDNNLELSTGYTRHGTEEKVLNRAKLSVNVDIVECVLIQSSLTLTTGNLYLRRCLDNTSWNFEIPRLQDNIWMIDICSVREWKWAIFHHDVAVWYHHNLIRISKGGKTNCIAPWFFYSKVNLWYALNNQGRLTDQRSNKIIENLTHYIHFNFPRNPIICNKMFFDLMKIKKISNVNSNFEYLILFREWLMVPYRRVKHKILNLLRGEKMEKSIIRDL